MLMVYKNNEALVLVVVVFVSTVSSTQKELSLIDDLFERPVRMDTSSRAVESIRTPNCIYILLRKNTADENCIAGVTLGSEKSHS